MSLSEITKYKTVCYVEDIVEEELVTGTSKFSLKISVESNEGSGIPHFHVMKGSITKACLKFTDAEYFIHPEHPGTLEKRELSQVDKALRKVDPASDYGDTYFTTALKMWNRFRRYDSVNSMLPEDLKQPDYTKTQKP